jgi:hypothetical protein
MMWLRVVCFVLRCSNRSASLLQLRKTTKALADAEEVIRLQPEWDKGHFRKAAVLEVLDRQEEVRDRVFAAVVMLCKLLCSSGGC